MKVKIGPFPKKGNRRKIDIQIDKFVDLNKIIKMRCIFNYKFKKWVPVSVI